MSRAHPYRVPQVVIVGRPNVGKSSIFNWLAGRRIAIVEDVAGVTRDRLTYLMHAHDRFFELVDTGGAGQGDENAFSREIEEQIEAAVESADVILFVVDVQQGLTPLDEEVARRLLYVDTPVILVANKADNPTLAMQAGEFYRLGRGKLVVVSTVHNRGKEELLREICQRLPQPPDPDQTPPEPEMKLAIVGRRNTGKSTFVNTLAQAKRCIVSEIPGTTRDSVDVRFEIDGRSFVAIDTPGIMRRRSQQGPLDFYSVHRAQRSIRRADVVLLFFDATEPISRVDKQLAAYIAEQYKPCIFVVNKWDLVPQQTRAERWVRYLRETFRTMWYVPIAFIVGQTGKNVKALLNHAQLLFDQARNRIGTGPLNRLLRRALERHPPPLYKGRPAKIYYATQVGVEPPTIVMFCNNPAAFDQTYQRYLLGAFREDTPFAEVPIKIYLRRRQAKIPTPEGLPPEVLAELSQGEAE